MTTTIALLLAIIPAALVILAAAVVRHAGPEVGATLRTVLLFEAITLILLILLTAFSFMPQPAVQPWFWIPYLFIPVIYGMCILILAYLPQLRHYSKKVLLLVALLGFAIAGFVAYHLREPSLLMMVVPGGIFTMGIAWLISTKPSRWVWVLPAIGVLSWLVLNDPNQFDMTRLPAALQTIVRIFIISAPVLTVAVMGLFVYTGLVLLRASPNTDQPNVRVPRVEGVLRLLTALGLLALTVYSTVWASIWDQTSDGLGGLFISELSSLGALAVGMVMSLRARGWNRLIGIAFAAVVAVSVNAGFTAGWATSFPELTERRGAQVAQALERFHNREHRYPQDLSELVPRDLLYIPQPVMFRTERWCYQGTANAYRLAAFYHEYFGMPVSLNVYASAGNLDDRPLPCQERLAAMQERYDWTHAQVSPVESLPAPTPAPTLAGAAAVQREPLDPVFATGGRFLAGRWSPDGKWWFFRVPSADGKQAELYFLEASTGRICPVQLPLAYDLFTDREPAAWISSSSLLFLDGSQQVTLYRPCQPGAKVFGAPDGVMLTQVAAADPGSGRLLLQSQDAYWLLQPGTTELQRISGVQPPPYQAHWDHAAWSPAGNILAISHLNSRNPKDGSTLYRIDGQTAQVIDSQKIAQASEQSAPFIEWAAQDAVLIFGPGPLLLVDYRSDPPRQFNAMKDLLRLDIEHPDQVFSVGSLPARNGSEYHLIVWANHPRNQNLIIYHSENGQLTITQPKSQAVLIFPDGQSTRMTRLEDPNQAVDILTLEWVDTDRAPLEIQVNGHLPRSYPRLDVRALPEKNLLVLASSNGVSLVSVPGGELLHFWQVGTDSQTIPYLVVSPDEKNILAVVDGQGIYQIPLEP